MRKAVMLNPVSYPDLVLKYGGNMKSAAREWKKLKKRAIVRKRPGRATNPARPISGTKSPAKKGGRPVPKKGIAKRKVAKKKVAGKRTVRGKAATVKRSLQGQPMKMTKKWRQAWGAGTLARGPASPISRRSPRLWKSGVRGYAAQPLDLAATLREVATAETLGHVLAASAGVTAPTLAPMLLEKVLKRPITGLAATGVGVGSTIAGFMALNAAGKPALARTFMAAGLGGILARILMEKLMPGTGAAAGLGQITAPVRRAIEAEVAETLAEEGLGQLTTQDVEELGGVGEVGQLTVDDLEELEGIEILE